MDVFEALAEPTRRSIIETLAYSGQLKASDIYKKFKLTPSAISQHLKVLKEAKLVRMEKKAQQRLYQLNPAALNELDEWTMHLKVLWNERFDNLDKFLTTNKEVAHGKKQRNSH